uniref:GDSL esterase/lipase EXL3 n=1 Tax=Salix viminalis TaxID=40686 RepID=A0A6N2LDE6_SALVM
MSSCFYSTLVLFLSIVGTVSSLQKLPPNVTVPALLFFGDSIVDAGNNNHLQTLLKCNFPPYGKNFEGGVPTGRFCNGNIPSDIIVLTLSDQLEHFKEYIGKLKAIIGEENTTFTLTNSLFVVVASSDDIANTYFTLRARALQYDVPAYTDLMANSASSFVQELYELGARRIGVFSAPPVGCVPSQRTLAGGAERECAENLNEAAKIFNSKLSKKLDSLASSLPSGRFVYLDIYNPLLDLIQNPRKYGFQVADKGCCGTGTLEVSILCNQYTSETCADVSDYVFWDSYHPTEGAYKALVTPVLGKYLTKFF